MSQDSPIGLPGGQPLTPKHNEKLIYRLCSAASIVWIGTGVVYAVGSGDNFLHMHPHEFASFLAGWLGPLSALWVVGAFLLQRVQLSQQIEQLEQARMEFRAELDRSERDALISQTDRLSERLFHSALRLVRKSSLKEFYLVRNEQTERVGDVFGSYRDYVEYYRPNDISPLVARLGQGLRKLSSFIEDEWMIHGSVLVIEDFEAELSATNRIAKRLGDNITRLQLVKVDEVPDAGTLGQFIQQADAMTATISLMLLVLREGDATENS